MELSNNINKIAIEEIKIIKNIPIRIADEEVYRYLGDKKDSRYTGQIEIQNIIREEIEIAYPLLENRGIYRFIPIDSTSEEGVIITEQGYLFLVNKRVIRFFQNARFLLVAIATIGPKIEQVVQERFNKNQYLKAIVMDAVGTVAVKTVGQWLNHYLERKINQRGFKLSRYFEPGSGDWDIEEQKKIFDILRPEKIGVNLNSCYMMQPVKSLSWIRAMGQNLLHSYRNEFSCNYCSLSKCPFRKSDST